MTTTSGTEVMIPRPMRPIDRKALENAGVVFGKVKSDNPRLTSAILPEGWTMLEVGTDSYTLVDRKGRTRALIHMGGPFYAYVAKLDVRLRYDAHLDDANGVVQAVVTDASNGRILFRSRQHAYSEEHSEQHKAAKTAALEQAQNWLDAHYPNWRRKGKTKDPSAYWD